MPGKFPKGSQGKSTSPLAASFLAFQPAPLSGIVLAFRSVNSGCYAELRSALDFLYYHAQSTSPCSLLIENAHPVKRSVYRALAD